MTRHEETQFWWGMFTVVVVTAASLMVGWKVGQYILHRNDVTPVGYAPSIPAVAETRRVTDERAAKDSLKSYIEFQKDVVQQIKYASEIGLHRTMVVPTNIRREVIQQVIKDLQAKGYKVYVPTNSSYEIIGIEW